MYALKKFALKIEKGIQEQMVKKRKYEKYVNEVHEEAPLFPDKVDEVAIPLHHDMGINELSPHFIDIGMNIGPHATGYGETMVFPNTGIRTRSFPHKHAVVETFSWIGTNPDDPDDLGGTVEYWLGEGEEAEPHIITKPATLLLPPNTVQFPVAYREVRKPFLTLTILDSPLQANISVPKVPSAFSLEKGAKLTSKVGKYDKLFSERDVAGAAVFPSHKGKSHVVLQYGMRQNKLAPHFIEVNLVYGAGIGWGCGDMTQYPAFQTRSVPHRHGALETYCFIGTDKDHRDELGGTVEFWIGEGEEAEEYIITKPTVVLIPPMTVHLPLYVREVYSPFVLAAFLNTPLWAALPSGEFPPDFKHIVGEK